MKRKILFVSTAGIAAGLMYALESIRRTRGRANRESPTTVDLSANGKAPAMSGANRNDSTDPGASMARTGSGKAVEPAPEAHQLDDHGTDQAGAVQILKEIRDTAFEASNEKLALALGRPTEEIERWTNGDGLVDGDVVMKARALALQRGLELE